MIFSVSRSTSAPELLPFGRLVRPCHRWIWPHHRRAERRRRRGDGQLSLGDDDRVTSLLPEEDALVEHGAVLVPALAELVDDDAGYVVRTSTVRNDPGAVVRDLRDGA